LTPRYDTGIKAASADQTGEWKMSAATLYVVYGINLSEDRFISYKQDIERLDDEEIATSYYCSYDDNPVCLGVKLCTVLESETVQLSNLVLAPSDQHKNNFDEIFKQTLSHNGISSKFKETLTGATPDTFIMWGSD
jgi:hypothetical protein